MKKGYAVAGFVVAGVLLLVLIVLVIVKGVKITPKVDKPSGTSMEVTEVTPEPTLAPTPEPTLAPTPEPTLAPTPEPTLAPTPESTVSPVVVTEPTADEVLFNKVKNMDKLKEIVLEDCSKCQGVVTNKDIYLADSQLIYCITFSVSSLGGNFSTVRYYCGAEEYNEYALGERVTLGYFMQTDNTLTLCSVSK